MRSICQADLEKMSRGELLAALQAPREITPTTLTYLAEQAGPFLTHEEAARFIAPLLTHEKPYVREGAVYGLGPHLSHAGIMMLMRQRLRDESNPIMRDVIKEMLEDHPAG